MLAGMLTVDETTEREANADFLSVYHLISPRKIGQRHPTILLRRYLSSMMRCEEIKPDIFYINRDMPSTGPASPLRVFGLCYSGHAGWSPYYLSIQL